MGGVEYHYISRYHQQITKSPKRVNWLAVLERFSPSLMWRSHKHFNTTIKHNRDLFAMKQIPLKKNKKHACISRCIIVYVILKRKKRVREKVKVYWHMCSCCLVVIINRFGFPGPLVPLHGNTCFECSKFSLFIIFLHCDIMNYTQHH